MRKLLSLLLTLAMIFTMVIGGTGLTFAASGSTEATTMKIAGTDGTVTITTDKGKDIAAKVDTKLLNGYTIKTAAASYCFISLDDSKAIKLGQNTKVKVEKSGKKIELDVKNGEIYFDVDKKLSGNESMNIKTGNMTTGIRGTSGVARILEQIAKLQLFSGSTQSKAVGLAGTSTTLNIAAGQELNASFTDLNAGTNPSQPTQPAEGTQPGQQVQTETAADGVSISTNPIAMDNFAVRSIIETSAIKSGVSATQALAAKAEEIIEKAADLLQKLTLSQDAKVQLEKATSEPEKLDTAKANAEAQAAIEQTLNEQTIETAQQEAAQAPGTTTDTTESKVLENVEVKTDAGANASALSLSEDGTSTTVIDTPTSTPHSSGQSGADSGTVRFNNYSGVYDLAEHEVYNVSTADLSNSTLYILKDSDLFAGFMDDLESLSKVYREGTQEAGFNSYLQGAVSGQNYGYATATSAHPFKVKYVEDSGTYYTCQVKEDGSYTALNSFTVSITKAELGLKWVTRNIEQPQGASFRYYNDNRMPSVTPTLGIKTASGIETIAVDGLVQSSVTTDRTIDGPGDYTLSVSEITENGAALSNFTYSPSDNTYRVRLIEYTAVGAGYYLSNSDTGDSGRATLPDNANIDLMYKANDSSGDGTYAVYKKSVLQSETATIRDIMSILSDPASGAQYGLIVIDTGSTVQNVPASLVGNNLKICSGNFSKNVHIIGAGFNFEGNSSLTIVQEGNSSINTYWGSTSGGNTTALKVGKLIVKEEAGVEMRKIDLVAADDITVAPRGNRLEIQSSSAVTARKDFIIDGRNTRNSGSIEVYGDLITNDEFKNSGNITLRKGMSISGGDVFENTGTITLASGATGSINVEGSNTRFTLGDEQGSSGNIVDDRMAYISTSGEVTSSAPDMIKLGTGATFKMLNGSLKRKYSYEDGTFALNVMAPAAVINVVADTIFNPGNVVFVEGENWTTGTPSGPLKAYRYKDYESGAVMEMPTNVGDTSGTKPEHVIWVGFANADVSGDYIVLNAPLTAAHLSKS